MLVVGDFERDRLIVASLMGEARHRSRWRPLTGEEESAAVAELRLVAGGRTDLLAEVAGILLGTSEGETDEALARQGAGLCLLAGADLEQIPGWVAEGRRRKASAGKPPFSAPKRRRPPHAGLGPGLAARQAGRGVVPQGRRRRRGDPGVDRRRTAPAGERRSATVQRAQAQVLAALDVGQLRAARSG